MGHHSDCELLQIEFGAAISRRITPEIDGRIATNQDYIYTRQDIDEFQKLQADKTASLNERERLIERQEADARQKARDQERAARKSPDVKIYELTVAKAGEPGLPPPLDETNTVTATNLTAGANSTQTASTNVRRAAERHPPLTPCWTKRNEFLKITFHFCRRIRC